MRFLIALVLAGAACTATVPGPDPDRCFDEPTYYIRGVPGEEICEELVYLYEEGTAFGRRCDSGSWWCGEYERRDGTIFVQLSELDGGSAFSLPEAGGDRWGAPGALDEPNPDCGDD